MRATTLQQIEDAPADIPDLGNVYNTISVDPAAVWKRIEHYCAHRWSARACTWVVEGEGWWSPPLTPATVVTAEVWENDAWAATELSPSPLGGFRLRGCGPYRFTAHVGGGVLEVPAAVREAFMRLAEYMSAKQTMHGASAETVVAGSVRVSKSREPAWMAKALQNSGAADLLRPYRSAP